jgi:serine/threonine-protein kinase
MFSLLTGRAVHEGETVNQLLFASMTRAAEGLSELLPDLHPDLVALVDRALAFKPDDRFASVRAMLLELRQVRSALEQQTEAEHDDLLDAAVGEESTLRWAPYAKPMLLPPADDIGQAPTQSALVWLPEAPPLAEPAPQPERQPERQPRPTLVRRRRHTALWAAAVVVAAVAGLFALLLSGSALAADADAALAPRLTAKLAASASRASTPVMQLTAQPDMEIELELDAPPRATTTVEVEPAPAPVTASRSSSVPALPWSLRIR